jgi:cell division protein FtsQ
MTSSKKTIKKRKFLANFWVNFLASNPTARRINLFYGRYFRQFFGRFFLALIFLSFFVLGLVKFYRPNLFLEFENAAYRKIFSTVESSESSNFVIKISGTSKISNQEILEIVENFYKNNNSSPQKGFSPLQIQELIDELKSQLPLASKIKISRTIPNIISISINEFVPFTIWVNDGKKFLIDKDGNAIDFREEYSQMPELQKIVILSGKNANIQAQSLFSLLSMNKKLSEEIYSANWVGARRWDLRFSSGLLVKMPENKTSEAWAQMTEILKNQSQNQNFGQIKVIDLRVADKIFIEYLNSTTISKSNQKT